MNSNLPTKQIINYIKEERNLVNGRLFVGANEEARYNIEFTYDQLTSHLIVLDEIENKLEENEIMEDQIKLYKKALKCLPKETIEEFYGFIDRALEIEIRELRRRGAKWLNTVSSLENHQESKLRRL